MPDWALHQASWLSLPRQPELWGSGYTLARDLIISVANTLIDFEPVYVLCHANQSRVLKRYFDSRVQLVESAKVETWLRDCTPTIAEKRGLSWLSGDMQALEFSAHFSGRLSLSERLAGLMNMPVRRIPFSMHDGDYSVDGCGSILLSGGSVLDESRIQPDRLRIEHILDQRFGIKRAIWLPNTLHYDRRRQLINLARFVGPSSILLAKYANRTDKQRKVALLTYDKLSHEIETDHFNKPFSVTMVHNPPPLQLSGRKLCNSYLNYYVANGIVCIPGFYKPRFDRAAKELFRSLFPGYHICQFQVLPLLALDGGLHSITRPWPAGRKMHSQMLDTLLRVQEMQAPEFDIEEDQAPDQSVYSEKADSDDELAKSKRSSKAKAKTKAKITATRARTAKPKGKKAS